MFEIEKRERDKEKQKHRGKEKQKPEEIIWKNEREKNRPTNRELERERIVTELGAERFNGCVKKALLNGRERHRSVSIFWVICVPGVSLLSAIKIKRSI